MKIFEIECGKHHGIVDAKGIGSAWRKLTGKKTKGFAPLARYRQHPISTRSYALGLGVWFYIEPAALDTMKP